MKDVARIFEYILQLIGLLYIELVEFDARGYPLPLTSDERINRYRVIAALGNAGQLFSQAAADRNGRRLAAGGSGAHVEDG